MRFCLGLVVAVCLCGTFGAAGCAGGGCVIYVSEALDVRGASNTPCTLTIINGNNLTLDIPAPSPAVPDTSLAPRSAAQRAMATTACAGGETVATSSDLVTITRTSDTLCVMTPDVNGLATALGTRECRNTTLTLVCAGITLYDRVAIDACSCQG